MRSIWLLLGIAAAVQARSVSKQGGDPDELEWPAQYSLKALRTSLTDHVIENYQVWRTSKNSRVDYNDGYVKKIVKKCKHFRYGVKYSVHPIADEDQEVENACSYLRGSKYHRIHPESILPDLDEAEYEAVGNETIHDKEAVKFVYDYTDETTDKRNTVWAYYDDKQELWIPVRYEVLEFSVWLGSKEKHEIWDFFDFDTSFSYREAFDVADDYDCEEEDDDDFSSNTRDTGASTKNLWFVDSDNEDHVHHVFEAFKKDHARTYADDKEHSIRKSIFKKNLRRVIEHNRRNLGYKLAINKFADKTPEEMHKHMGLLRRPEGKAGDIPFPYDSAKIDELSKDVPSEYDLRLQGLVGKILNQEECGSCWTFGTTAAAEGALARVNGGELMSLSQQALVDCAWPFGSYGCNGGSDTAAYEWMKEFGLPTEAEYGSYLNQDGECHILNMTKTFKIRGYTDVTPRSSSALKVAVINHGPLSVSVDVTPAFSLYSSGIFYDIDCDETTLNHEVTLVGYGERDGDTFWILKNSWGPSWGIGGYMYISARDNNCGVTTEPTYIVF